MIYGNIVSGKKTNLDINSVTVVQGCQERGDVELPLNTLIFTQNAGEQVHTKGNDVNTGQKHWEH